MKKLILLSTILFFSNVYALIAQDYNDMNKKELRIEHSKKLKSIDSLSQELNNKINENGLLKIKVDSLNKQLLLLNSNFNKVQVDLKLAIENSNKIAKNNESMKNRIKELEIELSNSEKIVSDLQNAFIMEAEYYFDQEYFYGNNKDICSFLNWSVNFFIDINNSKLLYDADENYFNTDIGEIDLLRLQKEINLLESESDNFFEERDGRTEADVELNIELFKSCPKYDQLLHLMEKASPFTSFLREQKKIKGF